MDRRTLLRLAPAPFGLMLAGRALAQPSAKPLRLIVGYPPGGGMDISSRLIANALRKELGDSVLVENRPGAGGRISVDFVKASEPDGSTVLMTPNYVFTIYPHLYRSLNYDLARDFVPVAPFASVSYSVSVGPAVPESVRSVADYAQWVRANPRLASFGTGSPGTTPHFTGVMLAKALSLPLVHVPYKGGAPLAQDLMGGQVPMGVHSLPEAVPLVRAGKLRSLAVSGGQRSPALPGVPTLVEAGFRELNTADVFGAFVPARTPDDVVRKLAAAIQNAVRSPETQEALDKLMFQSVVMQPAAYAQSIGQETRTWSTAVQLSGFKAEE